jgi:CheY-like chemotaxis protein
VRANALEKPIDLLLVEDNPDDREFIHEWVSDRGLSLALAAYENGSEALNYLQAQSENLQSALPKLILLDLNLPGIKGLDVLKTLKNHASLRKIPVVIFSSSVATSDVSNAYDSYANAYMTKGTDLAEMYLALDHIHEYWFSQAKIPN